MRSRYSKYFLSHIIGIEDHYCRYYVQDFRLCHEDILDVPSIRFFFEEEAELWLSECIEYEPWDTPLALRRFLSEEAGQGYPVHRMDDAAVTGAVARELALHGHKVVIRPKHGMAVELRNGFAGHVFPFRLSPPPDIDTRLGTLKKHLGELVLEQSLRMKSYEESPPITRQTMIKSSPGRIEAVIRTFPGFHADLVRQFPAIGQAQEEIHEQGHIRGNLQEQIETLSDALHTDRERSLACSSMIATLLTDPETMEIIQDFSFRHLAATPAEEREELGISTTADMFTAFIMATALLASDRDPATATLTHPLARAAELLRQLSADLRSTEPRRPKSKTKSRSKTAKTEQPPDTDRTPPADPSGEPEESAAAPAASAALAADTKTPDKEPEPEKVPFGFKVLSHIFWEAYDKGSKEFRLGTESEAPVPNKKFKIKLSDGSIREETTDENGCIEIADQEPGDTFEIIFEPENAGLNCKYHLLRDGKSLLEKTL